MLYHYINNLPVFAGLQMQYDPTADKEHSQQHSTKYN